MHIESRLEADGIDMGVRDNANETIILLCMVLKTLLILYKS